ncbi:DNA primase [Flavobacterium macacae]|uniref:DNA primase n=1 Tax=Flavobacterium macacae TaxID=2488993 RepID=A0A3P3W3R0_9FLAO|nr:DNA primase [Flavobacterium macacae]RRJ89028.1 DNA primase [Flavobacterium macacae]
MKRIIVDYSKLTNEILTLLVERFPDGYDDSNIIRFRNAKDEMIEAVEVRTEDTIYLVKVSTKLASRIENFDEDDDLDDVVVPIDAIKGLDLDDDIDDDEEEEKEEKIELDDEDDEDRDVNDIADEEDDEEED